MNKCYGVIDIGTLKVKLQIVEKTSSGELKTIEQSNILTCLGCQMEENENKPKPENLNNLLKELKRCKKLLTKYKVQKTRVVSTHALREMGKVGQEIAQLIKEETGFEIEIINQKEEAELFYSAVISDFNTDEDFAILDMGGGSVQILIGNRKELKDFYLLKTGTSTLWSKFTPENTGKDHPSKEQLDKMREYILQQLQSMPENIKTPIIWGSSCVIDVFKGMNLPLGNFSFSPSHPYQTSVSALEDFLLKVWDIPLDRREEIFVSPTAKYMWGIDMALLNIIELAKKIQAPYVIPSNANINQGLLLSLVD